MRSTFGVGWPRAPPPPEYAPKSFQPVSSVISMTMFGLLSAALTGPMASTSVARTGKSNVGIEISCRAARGDSLLDLRVHVPGDHARTSRGGRGRHPSRRGAARRHG